MKKQILISTVLTTVIVISVLSLFSFKTAEPLQTLDMPIGSIIIWAGESPPNNDWEICQGQRKLKTANPELYASIGGYWNKDIGQNEDFFQLPDLRGVFLRGVSGLRNDSYRDVSPRKSLTGEPTFDKTVGSFQMDALQGHHHKSKSSMIYVSPNNGGTVGGNKDTWTNLSNIMDGYATDGKNGNPRIGSETVAKNAYVNFIIKVR